MFEIPSRRLDIRLVCSTSLSFNLVCGFKEPLLPLELILIDPSRLGCRFESGNYTVDILPEPCVNVNCYCRSPDARVYYCSFHVLADDHRDTCPDNRDPLRFELLFRVPQDIFKNLLPPEDEFVVRKRGCQHPEPVLFQQTGMFERAARGPMEDRKIHSEIPDRIECGHDRAWSWLYIVHLLISRS